ncbi:MAG TPA: DUF4190 domain-containing protein [Frankiaceae bacterium]
MAASETHVGQQARNGFGVAALVLGILSIVGFFLSWIALILGVLAIVFGVLGRKRAQNREATNGGMATAGLVMGVVGVVIFAILLAIGISIFASSSSSSTNGLARTAVAATLTP